MKVKISIEYILIWDLVINDIENDRINTNKDK